MKSNEHHLYVHFAVLSHSTLNTQSIKNLQLLIKIAACSQLKTSVLTRAFYLTGSCPTALYSCNSTVEKIGCQRDQRWRAPHIPLFDGSAMKEFSQTFVEGLTNWPKTRSQMNRVNLTDNMVSRPTKITKCWWRQRKNFTSNLLPDQSFFTPLKCHSGCVNSQGNTNKNQNKVT